MAFQLGDDDSTGMNEMNLIPLIDIMLVLMIIFMVTATVLNPTVPLDLPKPQHKSMKSHSTSYKSALINRQVSFGIISP